MNAVIDIVVSTWDGANNAVAGAVEWWHGLSTVEAVSLGVLAWFIVAAVLGPVVGAWLGRRSEDYPAVQPAVSETQPVAPVTPRADKHTPGGGYR